jgi:dimethylhistidine N-methyltransferase
MPQQDALSEREAFARDVRLGLTSSPKFLYAKYFYDTIGSELFEKITRQPEYYLTRVEAGLLRQWAPAVAGILGSDLSVVELGSGSSAKTTILIESLLDSLDDLHYLPIDISRTMLRETAARLDRRYPELGVTPIASRYEPGLAKASAIVAEQTHVPDRMLVVFLGSSIGNLNPSESQKFLSEIRQRLEPKDALLIGFDLQKDDHILNAAYNDAAGVTARFNKNVLVRINRELEGSFDLDRFAHHAFFRRDLSRVEMHLVSDSAQEIRVGALDESFPFAAKESIHTENSYKFTRDGIEELASATDFELSEFFTDDDDWFALALLIPR